MSSLFPDQATTPSNFAAHLVQQLHGKSRKEQFSTCMDDLVSLSARVESDRLKAQAISTFMDVNCLNQDSIVQRAIDANGIFLSASDMVAELQGEFRLKCWIFYKRQCYWPWDAVPREHFPAHWTTSLLDGFLELSHGQSRDMLTRWIKFVIDDQASRNTPSDDGLVSPVPRVLMTCDLTLVRRICDAWIDKQDQYLQHFFKCVVFPWLLQSSCWSLTCHSSMAGTSARGATVNLPCPGSCCKPNKRKRA